ncbi:hypothetical protein J437_LFUL007187 [Ladona fulva]|uniref:Uncharacterized protein n=1 Tax=Ladona fulva TaxID=123851 RepID=A0A8K0K558_LADFU|nr:hypothetical protein J437_LFUL007187 [Ladona fulva]
MTYLSNVESLKSAEMSGRILDTSVLQELRSNIEKLTHSGQKTLDEKLLKALKNICKQSDKYVERGYQMILHDLQKDHSEIRYSALQIADELFR